MHHETPGHLERAKSLATAGRLEEAAQVIEVIEFADRFAPAVLAMRVEVHMGAQHWARAARVSRALALQCPFVERAWMCWARALLEMGRPDQARAVLLRAEPLHGSRSAALHYNLARCHALLGNKARASKSLELALKMHPPFVLDAARDPSLVLLWRAQQEPHCASSVAPCAHSDVHQEVTDVVRQQQPA